ncbi:pilus assembly protein PilM [Burkholderia sp. AU16741]|uniref:type IV pilus biogenesis protein PilM n=1 Tax=unclassified Burkholderia TaxID=2613784 RepID=UPI000B7AECC6|nr:MULTISPECIES: type IV pilus biogenesis protein PilM [unclassified Burkholderia]MDN7426329.1 type IV pilus biogenesis protein PilM [Burkholderia sp. AU45388]OXI30038.1 pilus assembly protein PilM [Burkholderia sp. AU16741]
MFALWIAAAMIALAGVYALVDARAVDAAPTVTATSMGQSMAAYRLAGVRYALANPAAAGTVSDGALGPYLGAGAANPLWRVYVAPNTTVAGSMVVVYTTSTAAGAAIPVIEALAFHSALAGAAHAGAIVSPGNPAVVLPAIVAAAVPEGAPVWMAQAY